MAGSAMGPCGWQCNGGPVAGSNRGGPLQIGCPAHQLTAERFPVLLPWQCNGGPVAGSGRGGPLQIGCPANQLPTEKCTVLLIKCLLLPHVSEWISHGVLCSLLQYPATKQDEQGRRCYCCYSVQEAFLLPGLHRQ